MPGEALREYLAPEGVSVSLVYPGYIQTAQTACHIGASPLQILPDRAAAIIRSRVADLSAPYRFDCSCKAEYGKSEQLVCIFVLCWRARSFNRSSRARTSAFFDRPRRFELR